VEAWQDNVHEHGTREYGSGRMKSGFRDFVASGLASPHNEA
jgi:hypothetical protein